MSQIGTFILGIIRLSLLGVLLFLAALLSDCSFNSVKEKQNHPLTGTTFYTDTNLVIIKNMLKEYESDFIEHITQKEAVTFGWVQGMNYFPYNYKIMEIIPESSEIHIESVVQVSVKGVHIDSNPSHTVAIATAPSGTKFLYPLKGSNTKTPLKSMASGEYCFKECKIINESINECLNEPDKNMCFITLKPETLDDYFRRTAKLAGAPLSKENTFALLKNYAKKHNTPIYVDENNMTATLAMKPLQLAKFTYGLKENHNIWELLKVNPSHKQELLKQ